MPSAKQLDREKKALEKVIQPEIDTALQVGHNFAGQGGEFEFAHENEVVYEGEMLSQLPLGIAFADYTTKKEKSILVAGVKPESLAGRSGGLEVGMVLKRVQGKKVAGMSFKHVMDMVKQAKTDGTQLRLQFASYDDHMNGSRFGQTAGAKSGTNPLTQARRSRKFNRLKQESSGVFSTAAAVVAALSPRRARRAAPPHRASRVRTHSTRAAAIANATARWRRQVTDCAFLARQVASALSPRRMARTGVARLCVQLRCNPPRTRTGQRRCRCPRVQPPHRTAAPPQVEALSPRSMISPRGPSISSRSRQDNRVGQAQLTPRRFRSPVRWSRHQQVRRPPQSAPLVHVVRAAAERHPPSHGAPAAGLVYA